MHSSIRTKLKSILSYFNGCKVSLEENDNINKQERSDGEEGALCPQQWGPIEFIHYMHICNQYIR